MIEDIIWYPHSIIRFLVFFLMFRLEAKCVECGSSNILYDKHHAEIYCGDCGLVLVQLHRIPNENLFLDYNFQDFKEVQNYKSIDDVS